MFLDYDIACALYLMKHDGVGVLSSDVPESLQLVMMEPELKAMTDENHLYTTEAVMYLLDEAHKELASYSPASRKRIVAKLSRMDKSFSSWFNHKNKALALLFKLCRERKYEDPLDWINPVASYNHPSFWTESVGEKLVDIDSIMNKHALSVLLSSYDNYLDRRTYIDTSRFTDALMHFAPFTIVYILAAPTSTNTNLFHDGGQTWVEQTAYIPKFLQEVAALKASKRSKQGTTKQP